MITSRNSSQIVWSRTITSGTYPVPSLFYTEIKQYEQHAGQTIPAGSEIPSQSGTTLQSDWFWKLEYPTQELRPARQIVEEWLVPFNERHCNLILNVAPNRSGQFDQNALDRLAEVGRLWKNPGSAPKLCAVDPDHDSGPCLLSAFFRQQQR